MAGSGRKADVQEIRRHFRFRPEADFNLGLAIFWRNSASVMVAVRNQVENLSNASYDPKILLRKPLAL